MFTFFNQGILPTLINRMETSAGFAMLIAGIVLCALIGYLLGSFNFALILSRKMYKDDIRKHGSKNAGTTNMMRTYGSKAAGLTILGDMLKAVVAVILGALLMGLYFGGYAAALGCVVGHVFPVFFGFKGGKGVATAAAAMKAGLTDGKADILMDGGELHIEIDASGRVFMTGPANISFEGTFKI